MLGQARNHQQKENANRSLTTHDLHTKWGGNLPEKGRKILGKGYQDNGSDLRMRRLLDSRGLHGDHNCVSPRGQEPLIWREMECKRTWIGISRDPKSERERTAGRAKRPELMSF